MNSKNLTIALLIMIVLAAMWTNGKLQRILAAMSGKVTK